MERHPHASPCRAMPTQASEAPPGSAPLRTTRVAIREWPAPPAPVIITPMVRDSRGPSPGADAMKFAEMTFPQLRQVPRESTVLVAPIAACEQHSHHLPTITDTVLVTGVAEGVEERLRDEVL